ncbi:acyltransferase [Streptomyces sp. IBSBF 2953]|uniref:acyltransferase family protein n=1 Tax=Streptomyces TaxID=1883 RepID=UPI00211A1200|nr:acyltransferase [Streptomyces hayashii]
MSTHPTEATAELPELPGPQPQNTVPAPREEGPGEASGTKRSGGRDRYFDLLRAVALFRVVLYHLMGWAWLPVVFPSMGVMFALAGDLMARSLSRRPALEVARGRLRRLLPPLWLLGAVGVTGMLAGGWGPDAEGHPGWWWLHLTFWILPVSDPPYADGLSGIQGFIGDDWASDLGVPLWYIRAYLWFVLLSPLLLRALRRLPWPTVLAPIALCAALEFGALTVPSWRLESNLSDFGTFGACWLLGMARQEGVLRRLPRYVVPSLAPAVAALGLWYALSHHLREGHDLDDMPFGQSLWSFAAVLLLLHISPSWSEWPPRLRRWDRLITLLNSRAVTIYLWHNVCITVVEGVWDRLWDVPWLEADAPWILQSPWPQLPAVWLLTAFCVVCFGWVEDLAARRTPRLWPDGRTGTHRA